MPRNWESGIASKPAPTLFSLLTALPSLFPGPLPALDNDLARAPQCKCTVRDICGNGRARANARALADDQRRHQRAVRTDEDIIANHRPVLGRAIVVAGNHARAHVDVRTNIGIAEIGQVIGLAAMAKDRIFQLDKVSDM